jgi:two-component system, CAI-1 autoinducer sensor kinase/phosphatase CqsS
MIAGSNFYHGRAGLTMIVRRLATAFIDYHAHAPFRIRAIAWLGVISLPLYYFVWTFIFPQHYENLLLRLVGAALCLALALSHSWPPAAKHFYYPFVYAVLILVLPMFFTFMLLMNQMSVAWQMSTISGLLFVALLFDTANTAVAVVVGVVFGTIGYMLVSTDPPLTWAQLENVPVMLFTLAAIRILLAFNDRFVAEEKMRAARTLAGHIAHEMRTPLLGIQLDAGKARNYMPVLVDALEFARAHGWKGKNVRPAQLDLLTQSMSRIREHATSAGMIVDMLLFNARHDAIDRQGFRAVSVAASFNKAMDRYYFRGNERGKVHVTINGDFHVLGAEVMLVHVFFNLLKNALRAVEPDPQGRVEVRIDAADLSTGKNEGTVVIADTGPGIPAHLLPDLFTAFRTTSAAGTGSGLGLAFCKLAVDSSGGRITASRAPGYGAVLTMVFPVTNQVPDDQDGRSPASNLASIASNTGSSSATVSTT